MAGIKYGRTPDNIEKSVKAKASNIRVSYKNTFETANALKGMKLKKAVYYLNDVKAHKRCIPFRQFNRGVGRTPQCKEWKHTQGRWPEKSCDFLLSVLKNLESNAEKKGLNVDSLVVNHVSVNQAAKMRRRTYRAHGRINAYLSSPSHLEIIATEEESLVPKSSAEPKKPKLTQQQIGKALHRRKYSKK
eukprot:NODE_29_length_37665_cov_1.081563.p21 type:complete len:189 gc:universal NODE_29_length_37665_cov_1.081563:32630-33196(+)